MGRPRGTARIGFLGVLMSLFNPGITTAADVDPLRPPAISTENVPAVSRDLMERLRRYQNVRAAGFRGWSPDGQGMLVVTRFGDTAQLHQVYEPGGRREQLTFFLEPADGLFIPEARDRSLLVLMSQGGDENNQVYFLDRATGQELLLTDGKSRNTLGAVRHDGSQMVIASNQRNGRDTDLYLAAPRVAQPLKMLLQTDGEFWSARDWSRDGQTLLINRYVSANESYPALLNVTTGQKRMLPIPGGGPASFGAMAFAADGKSLLLTSDANGAVEQLARVDLATLEYTWLTADLPWEVDAIEVDQVSGKAAFTTNSDGASELYLLDGNQRTAVSLPLGIVSSLQFSPDGKRLGFTLSRPNGPADAYSLEVDKPPTARSTPDERERALTRWTFSEVGGLNPDSFIEPQRISFPSFDARSIPAYYFKPRTASREKPAPVLIQIHGGPESQYRPSFAGTEQFYLQELGMAVIHPNVRGSSGYGKEYLKLDNAEKREDSVRDIGALLDWIAKQPELDASRVAVMGASYGGYMVLASLVHHGDRIKAGVDVVGIASFTTFLKNTSAYRRDLRRAEYGDERDPQMQAVFERINPLNNADRIRSALLVAHGRNDPRVPFSEAEQIAARVRANGREVWTVYADNEGHGFARKLNRDYLAAVVVLFLRQNL